MAYTQEAVLLSGLADDEFGAVAISQDGLVLIVGSPADTSSTGNVRTYDRVSNAWVLRGSPLTASDAASGDRFGASVAISPDKLVLAVGAPDNNFGNGTLYVYDWSGSAWIERATILVGTSGAAFGSSCALGTDELAVGAPFRSSTTGGVYTYDRSGGGWTQRGALLTNGGAGTGFGASVAMVGTNLVVGIFGGGAETGGVYTYDRSGSSWVQRGVLLLPADIQTSDRFYSVSLSSDSNLLAVGSHRRPVADSFGAVYLFDRNVSAWDQKGSPAPLVGQVTDSRFGKSVALSKATDIIFAASADKWTGSSVGVSGVYTLTYTESADALMTGFARLTSAWFDAMDASMTGFKAATSVVFETGIAAQMSGFMQTTGVEMVGDDGAYTDMLGFASNTASVFGAEVGMTGFSRIHSANIELSSEAAASMLGFARNTSAVIYRIPQADAKQTGFSRNTSAVMGWTASMSGFSRQTGSGIERLDQIAASMSGFARAVSASLTPEAIAQATMTGFLSTSSVLFGADALMSGWKPVTTTAKGSFATVMNTATDETTRYTDYPFMLMANLGGVNFGIGSGGVYALGDEGEPTVPTIFTKETDFGEFSSKRCPYMYINGDTQVTVTPLVDGIQKLPQLSSYGGRKTHLARGNSGRYWQFKIENIVRLEGIEPLPELRQRRVK